MFSERAVAVLTTPERRRRWNTEQKLAIVAEKMRPGASGTQVARRYGLSTGLLYTWCRQVRDGALGLAGAPTPEPSFVPVQLTAAAGTLPSGTEAEGRPATGGMVIALPNGWRIEVDRHVDAAALARVLSVLDGR